MLPKVNTFLGCMTLKTGTRTIGCIFTVLAALACAIYSTPILAGLELPPATQLFYWLMAIISAVQLVTGTLLIIGAFQNKTSLLWPWMVVSLLQSVSLVVLALLTSFMYVAAVISEEIDEDVETNVIIIIYTAYALAVYYAASVVNSHRKELTEEKRRRDRTEEGPMISSNP